VKLISKNYIERSLNLINLFSAPTNIKYCKYYSRRRPYTIINLCPSRLNQSSEYSKSLQVKKIPNTIMNIRRTFNSINSSKASPKKLNISKNLLLRNSFNKYSIIHNNNQIGMKQNILPICNKRHKVMENCAKRIQNKKFFQSIINFDKELRRNRKCLNSKINSNRKRDSNFDNSTLKYNDQLIQFNQQKATPFLSNRQIKSKENRKPLWLTSTKISNQRVNLKTCLGFYISHRQNTSSNSNYKINRGDETTLSPISIDYVTKSSNNY